MDLRSRADPSDLVQAGLVDVGTAPRAGGAEQCAWSIAAPISVVSQFEIRRPGKFSHAIPSLSASCLDQ
jgi:hypothetical protein